MDVTILAFDAMLYVVGPAVDGVIVRLGQRYVRLAGDRATPIQVPEYVDRAPPDPFTFGTFGKVERLAWPGGGRALKGHVRVRFWGSRFAVVAEAKALTVVDGVASRQMRIELADAVSLLGSGIEIHDGRLYIGADQTVVALEVDVLEDLVAGDGRDVELAIRTVDPRQPDAPLLAEPARHTAKLVRGKTRDPGAPVKQLAPTARQPELERLLAEIAANPDSDEPRAVLVDLLQDLGEDYGTWLANVRDGDSAVLTKQKRRDALGPLAHYLDDVEFRAGLPWAATVMRKPPLDAALIDQALGDLRLGMLCSLRVGKGPISIYRKLIASPRASGLRRVDVPDRETILALIAAGRDQLTHLYDVRFAKTSPLGLLAGPNFDRATELETTVQLVNLEPVLSRVIADAHRLFKRVPRHLTIRERWRHDISLIEPVLQKWPLLPVAGVTISCLTLRHDGDVVRAHVADSSVPSSSWLPQLAHAERGIASIELAGDQLDPTPAQIRRHLGDVTIIARS